MMNPRAPLARLSVLALILLALLPVPANAAPARPAGQQVAAKEPSVVESTIATNETMANGTDEQAGCVRSRKRLWVGGEGWVVRRVTTCH